MTEMGTKSKSWNCPALEYADGELCAFRGCVHLWQFVGSAGVRVVSARSSPGRGQSSPSWCRIWSTERSMSQSRDSLQLVTRARSGVERSNNKQ